ncbi:putative F420-dependent oxidoreductase [Kitasatospora sp. SolWspMP-SS2h]|uniref:LLM class F420-dependent oxidoreductase n=1 Tax=Kitasatospora sp. SolWspMP-SS2h TaxID=1305729 RepID=UPI000DB97AF2|nr:LLM class F420-dependent oxidoreductase [Kitasatospora sp. SolWspMP-SS2h]RAJ32094.1 putative F420-dependent oxidoreductase [Kitasatospora sp. SolWspMP-SS2h]
MTRPLRAAAHIWPGGTPDYATWRAAVLHAEELGADVVFGYDHFHAPAVHRTAAGVELAPEQPDLNHFEGWTALASWAEITTRVEIGLLVTGVAYRNPDLLADMARTVDHISGGRLILGVGAGWYRKDYDSYGYPFGPLRERMDLFADGVRRIEDRLDRLVPPPLRPVPLLVGGQGERRTLPLAARYADIWHCGLEPAVRRRKDDLLREYADEAGRDEALIERAANWTGPAQADELRADGATLFVTELKPSPAGYDFTGLRDLLAWRDTAR